ncbi:MAG: magnesium-translocating P-type ATPase [Ignavibacteria bacterium]
MVKKLALNVIPKILPGIVQNHTNKISVSSLLKESAYLDAESLLSRMETSLEGLTSDRVEELLHQYGLNVIKQERQHRWLWFLRDAVINPLVILLTVIGLVSFVTGDLETTLIISLMVLLGVVLRFVQEYRADIAAAKLQAMISVTATVMRDGVEQEIPISHIVPGDIVKLAAGDMIPADVRLLSCKDLFVSQSSLTGESLPVEKFSTPIDDSDDLSAIELHNLCFLGTSVESGSATAIVVATGLNTYLGSMAKSMTEPQPPTSFDKGIKRFTWLMIRFIMVMVPLVFLINLLTKPNWVDAFFFSIAVAVGLTPEMLPMIVTVCLSKGALAMSKRKVIIKRLHSIQNLGAMDILCTDKTGTLTVDHVLLEKYCDVIQREDEEVLMMAYLNSHFQTGLRNVLDRAILQHENVYEKIHVPEYQKVDEIPFDFSRKVMSVIVETPEGIHRMITKGAPEEIFARCTHFELDGEVHLLEPILIEDLKEEYQNLSADGFRVLALAYKEFAKKPTYAKDDESGMVLKGYLAFLDPPKDTAAAAIKILQTNGVTIKILTGDNELVTRKICQEVGLDGGHLMLGSDVERITDEELLKKIDEYTIFARLSPANKQRIVQILRKKGHTVGFMGDGINDAPALRAADVSISVDTAVDIAKESSDVILLEKSLMVLEEGVLEGRRVFANILKYIRMSASSNFGNMFSVLGASIFLPFLPMMPIQILTNNLLYDFSQTPIPTDGVDHEQISKPRPWEIGNLTRFILFIGPISSIFDYTTFFIMLYIFGCWDPARASLFQTGWFVESLLTQTLIIHIIRTNKIPFLQSRASLPLLIMTALVMAIGIYIPHSPLGSILGFTPLPGLYWPLLGLTLFSYIILTQVIKMWLLKKKWI